jgi:hypothetical protein
MEHPTVLRTPALGGLQKDIKHLFPIVITHDDCPID